MGAILSSENPSNENIQNPSFVAPDMASTPPNSQNPDPETHQNQNPDPKIQDTQDPEISNQPIDQDETGRIDDESSKIVENDDDEEEGECGFCLFMKGGGCKDQFIAWEQCVEDSEKKEEDIVEKCFEITANLKKCMEAHTDYYEPILRAEKAAEEEVRQELDRENEKKAAEEEVKEELDRKNEKKSDEENAEIQVQNEG